MLSEVLAVKRNAYTKIIESQHRFTFDGTTPYILKDMRGIGPVKEEISDVINALDPGSLSISSRTPKRNIVMDIEFKPGGEGIDIRREQLYDVFMPGNVIELRFITSNLGEVWIMARIESHEPNIFTKTPTVQISAVCPDPYFRGDGRTTEYTVPYEDFPEFSVPFTGKVPVGFKFEGILNDYYDSVTLEALPYDFENAFRLRASFAPGDLIQVSSVRGERYARYKRSGQDYNVLGKFTGSLVSTKLHPGSNWFRLENFDRFSNVKFSYEVVYGGI